jgi:tetratricopeptide (TPR) repeat protein
MISSGIVKSISGPALVGPRIVGQPRMRVKPTRRTASFSRRGVIAGANAGLISRQKIPHLVTDKTALGGIAMTRTRFGIIMALAIFGLSIPQAVRAAESAVAKGPEEVNFATSCGPEAQKAFNHAVWTLHSFWYPEALKAFTEISKSEPGCAMAYWGIAMSRWYPLWYPPSAESLKAGSEAIEKAMAAAPKTDREKDYIAAIAAFYHDSDKLDHRSRAVAYEKAMEQVHARYPEDREAGVFYSLALNATQLPTDATLANKKKAAAILNKVWTEQPNHPGVVHYLIHADDSAQLAELGLRAAICYAKIAPEVPHALHMPSHIFTRLGLWQQSIESNRDGHAAAVKYVQKSLGPDAYDGETVHTMDYLEYAYLQTAQDKKAKQVLDELLSFRKGDGANLPMAYAVAAIPVRYALERRDWQASAALSAPAINFPLEKFPWAEAMISFGRALGKARTGDAAAAQAEIAKLQALEDKLKEAKDTYWANQVEVQRLGAAGILAHVQGDDKKAVELVRAAADLAATMDKHPATPAEALPARELLADLLLEIKDAGGALKEYQESLRTDPNRFRSVLGKARAAKEAGDATASRDAYQKLLTLANQADAERPELSEAKAFLSN